MFAFCLDAVSAFFSYIAGAKNNLNIKAVFLHNLADTLTSLAVIVSAIVMLIWHINGVDVIATLFISGFIIFQGFNLLKKSIKIIMQATPAEVDLEKLKSDLLAIEGVYSVDKVHVWQLDDSIICFEGTIAVNFQSQFEIKNKIFTLLKSYYNIKEITLETIFASKLINC